MFLPLFAMSPDILAILNLNNGGMNSYSTYFSYVPTVIQVLCQVCAFNPHNNPKGIIIYILQIEKIKWQNKVTCPNITHLLNGSPGFKGKLFWFQT